MVRLAACVLVTLGVAAAGTKDNNRQNYHPVPVHVPYHSDSGKHDGRIVVHKQTYEQPIHSLYHVPIPYYTQRAVLKPHKSSGYGDYKQEYKVEYVPEIRYKVQPISLQQKVQHDVVTVLLPKKRKHGYGHKDSHHHDHASGSYSYH